MGERKFDFEVNGDDIPAGYVVEDLRAAALRSMWARIGAAVEREFERSGVLPVVVERRGDPEPTYFVVAQASATP